MDQGLKFCMDVIIKAMKAMKPPANITCWFKVKVRAGSWRSWTFAEAESAGFRGCPRESNPMESVMVFPLTFFVRNESPVAMGAVRPESGAARGLAAAPCGFGEMEASPFAETPAFAALMTESVMPEMRDVAEGAGESAERAGIRRGSEGVPGRVAPKAIAENATIPQERPHRRDNLTLPRPS